MAKIKVPATSANLGIGFDCLGLALDILNVFEVHSAPEDELINVPDLYNNPENLFLKAYHCACEQLNIADHISASFACQIPISRGLGSSCALISAGLAAAYVLHDIPLNKEEIFIMAAQMEGHPDNAAPCIFGGFTAAMADNNRFIHESLSMHKSYRFYAFIPDFEVSTAKARQILPSSYEKKVAVSNSAKAILSLKAFENGDLQLLKSVCRDEIHEPYRKTLIPDFDQLEKVFVNDTGGLLLISGSGSTCLGIAEQEFTAFEEINKLEHHWQVHPCKVAQNGLEVSYED